MLKSFARAAGFLAYLFITLEMLFTVTPFALYYYSLYSPLLVESFSLPATGWPPAFFLPHLSTKILPSMGALIVLLGLIGFVLSAFQLHYAKFRRRGLVQSGLYKRIRHPQYLFLGLAGLGLLIRPSRTISADRDACFLWRCRSHGRKFVFIPLKDTVSPVFGWIVHDRIFHSHPQQRHIEC